MYVGEIVGLTDFDVGALVCVVGILEVGFLGILGAIGLLALEGFFTGDMDRVGFLGTGAAEVEALGVDGATGFLGTGAAGLAALGELGASGELLGPLGIIGAVGLLCKGALGLGALVTPSGLGIGLFELGFPDDLTVGTSVGNDFDTDGEDDP